jgi:hypothetical protein
MNIYKNKGMECIDTCKIVEMMGVVEKLKGEDLLKAGEEVSGMA